jgi:hypothetical protein
MLELYKGIGDVYLDGAEVKEEDIIPNIGSKNTIKAMCFCEAWCVIYIMVLIYFNF